VAWWRESIRQIAPRNWIRLKHCAENEKQLSAFSWLATL
jgi:hypothetical protein